MRWRERISVGVAGVALATSVLAVGGAVRGAQAAVAFLVAIALVPQLTSRRVGLRSPLTIALGVAAALTALQLLPVPESVFAALHPTGSSLRADGTELLGVASLPTLTLDPSATLRALVFFVTLLGIAAVALRLATTERGRFWILATVAALAGLTAVIVGVHELFGLTSLYGVYEPAHAAPVVLGPLLNANHLGGLMAVGTVLSIGLVMHAQQSPWVRAAWVVTLFACGIATVATLSRGATIGLGIGAAVTLAILVGQRLARTEASRRRRVSFLTSSLPIGIVATCTVLIVVLSSAGGVERELARTTLEELEQSTSKYAAWGSATHLIEESPWIGVGRGAFEASFTRVHPASGFVTFSHLENEYLQAVVDWGIPGALLLGLALLWLAATAARRWRDGPLAAGALGACVVIALQSNFDFGIQLLGIAAPMTAIVATLTYGALRPNRGRMHLVRGVRGLHVAGLVAGAALLLSATTTSLDEDHAVVASNTVTVEEVRAAATRHPLDYYTYARAAGVRSQVGDPHAIRLLNHALRLHPSHPGLHRMTARMLQATGRVDQAALEYAVALRVTRDPRRLIEEIVTTFPPEVAAQAIPSDYPRLDIVIRALRELGHPKIAARWLTEVLTARPKDVRACELLYDLALRENDLDAAEMAGRSCVEIVPDRTMRLSLARVLMRKEGYAEVVRLLHDVDVWVGRVDDKVEGWLSLCEAHDKQDQLDDAKRCLRRLDMSGYLSDERRAVVLKRLEAIEERRRAKEAAASGTFVAPVMPVPLHP